MDKGGLTDHPSRSSAHRNGHDHGWYGGSDSGSSISGSEKRGGGDGKSIKSITMRNYAPYDVEVIVGFGTKEQFAKYGRYIMKRKALSELF